MEENLGEIIFDIMTNEYKDKVDKNKDIVDYLNYYLYICYMVMQGIMST